jgi:hypothetical protein
MNILSALKTEASKLQKQLDTVNAAIKILGKERRPSWQEASFFRECAGEDV